jgi:hypothetical protein
LSVVRKGSAAALYQQALAILGDQDGEALATAFGGKRLYVPRTAGPHHPLTVELGPVAAEKLTRGLGGEHLDVPISAGRRAEILALKARGLKNAEIVRRVKCSRRLVYLVLEKARDETPPKQASLPF